MIPAKVEQLLFKFMADISSVPADDLKIKWKEVLSELGVKLSKVLSKETEIEEYLNSILLCIDDLNQYFIKQGKNRIPYSKLFAFANKDERISEFLVDKGLRKKISKTLGIKLAGFDDEIEKETLNVIYKDEIYEHIYSVGNRKFFFSPIVNRVVVQSPKGKIISYFLYKRKFKKRTGAHLSLSRIYRDLLYEGNKSETIKAFQKYMKALFIKNKAKNHLSN